MPFRTIRLQPGVDLEATPTLNQVRLAATTLVRFYNGLVEKLGGWVALTKQTFIGTCRGLESWADIVGNGYIAVGTEQRLEVLIGGSLYDITPLVATTNPPVSFSTIAGSDTVTITDADYEPNMGDWINLQTPVSVGGIVLSGFYQDTGTGGVNQYTVQAANAATATATVTNGGSVPVYTTTVSSASVQVTLDANGYVVGDTYSALVPTAVGGVTVSGLYEIMTIIDANNFTIITTGIASSTASVAENGGNAQIGYLLPSGFAVDTFLTGYGIGDYGAGDYGLSDNSEQELVLLRQWSLSNWGQDLIASPSGGGIYYWQPPTPSPAIVVSDTAPIYSTAVFTMPQVQIIVSLGSETGGMHEPLLIRWCDQGDFTDWTATATNQAGSFFLPSGSLLVGGLPIGLGALVWTDQDLWSMTYLGFPLVFGFNLVSQGCGLLAQRVGGSVGNLVMWLSTHQFFRYDIGGGVRPVECPVWDFYWNNTDQTQLGQYHCAVNSNFNEMAWFFPIAVSSPLYSADTQLGYVKFNYVENAWDYGISSQYQRTAWIGHTPAGSPVGADTAGLLQSHEVGNDANGEPMIGGWQTGYFQLTEGEDYPFIDLILPDFALQSTAAAPVITMNLLTTTYPFSLFGASPRTIGPFTVTSGPGGAGFIPCRARDRQVALSASWSDLGTSNRIGAIRVRYAPDGRAP